MQYNVVDREDSLNNAWAISQVLYKKTNKIPMKRQEFIKHADLAYMMGCSNTAKDIYHYIKSNPEADFDVIVGDLQLILRKAWNNMLENPIGKATIKEMDLEDILDETNVNALFKK